MPVPLGHFSDSLAGQVESGRADVLRRENRSPSNTSCASSLALRPPVEPVLKPSLASLAPAKKKTAPILNPPHPLPQLIVVPFSCCVTIAACKTAGMRCSPLCSLESHTPIPTSTIWRRLRLPCAGERLPAYQLLPTCQLANSCALAAKALSTDSTGHYRYTNTQTALVRPSWAVAVPELPPGDESRTCADVGTVAHGEWRNACVFSLGHSPANFSLARIIRDDAQIPIKQLSAVP